MPDKPAAETNPTDESHTEDTRGTAARAVIGELLGRVRRVLDRPTTAAADRSPASSVVVADGGQNNAKVIGHNKESGQTVGVWGEVDSADGCGLATPDDARIDGTIDTNETDFVVDAGTTATGDATNVVLGHASNEVLNGAVGAVIGGGGDDDGDTSEQNQVYDNYGVVGGGAGNDAGYEYETDPSTAMYATVSGGLTNFARGEGSAVGGGLSNSAEGGRSTVAGGGNNEASGGESTIAGGMNNTAISEDSTIGGGYENYAGGVAATVPGGKDGAAESDNTFVWNDGTAYHSIPRARNDGLSSDTAVDGEPVKGSQTFSVSAQGGVRFITGGSSVTYIDGGTAGWSNTSSRAAKRNIDPVDSQQVLDGVEDLEVATWEYKDDGDGTGTTHIGPMAEEFHDILDDDVGSSDDHINSINADGILFAAVQGLAERLNEETDRLAEENDQLRETLDAKDSRIDELETENDELRSRIADIEAHLGLGETETAPAHD